MSVQWCVSAASGNAALPLPTDEALSGRRQYGALWILFKKFCEWKSRCCKAVSQQSAMIGGVIVMVMV